MKPVLVKEALPLLDRVHLLAIQNEGDGSLHAVEGIINMVEGITTRSKKQTSILFFFIVKSFSKMFVLHWSSRLKGVLILKYSLFPHPFCQKMSTYLDRAKKRR